MRKLLIFGMVVLVSGCAAFSSTTLECGIDGEASYVRLVNFPQEVRSQDYADLCGFSFEGQER